MTIKIFKFRKDLVNFKLSEDRNTLVTNLRCHHYELYRQGILDIHHRVNFKPVWQKGMIFVS